MTYLTKLPSPVGTLHLASDGTAITGLWIEGQKYFAATLEKDSEEQPDLPLFRQAADWLSAYFAGEVPLALPPLVPQGSAFRQAVWSLLLEIPRGRTTTYGALAQELRKQGISASAQAVGGAVGHNPISILIPCHRVVGAQGSLTGYAGGIAAKQYLLELEGADMTGFYAPKKGTALPGASPRKYPCPCCGCKTFPAPVADAVAYICPVCMWENDVFTASDDEPSDENHGLTLDQGRKHYKTFSVCDIQLARYARKPLPDERNEVEL